MGTIITLMTRARARAFGTDAVRERGGDDRLMSALSGAWLVIALLQLVAWIGACVLGAGVGPLGRGIRAAAIAALALAGRAAASLGARRSPWRWSRVDWAWGAEKLLVAAPIGVLASVVRRRLRASATRPRAPRRARSADPARHPDLGGARRARRADRAAAHRVGRHLAGRARGRAGLDRPARRSRCSRRRADPGGSWCRPAPSPVLSRRAARPVHGLRSHRGDRRHRRPPPAAVAGVRRGARSPSPTCARPTTDRPVHRFDLEARHQTITLPDGSDYDAVTFGSVPGPQLVVTEGELVEVTLTNRDVEDGVTLHWHGYDVPSGDDGVAGVTQDAVAPGESFVYRFVADQVGTYWYHTHQDALEGIVRGLYGALRRAARRPRPRQPSPTSPRSIHTMSGTTLVGGTDVLGVPEIGPTRLRLVNTDQIPRRDRAGRGRAAHRPRRHRSRRTRDDPGRHQPADPGGRPRRPARRRSRARSPSMSSAAGPAAS